LDATQPSKLIPRAAPGDPAARLLWPAPPSARTGRAARAVTDGLDRTRNSLRILAEAHLVTAPLLAFACGLLAGCVLRVALRSKRRPEPII